MKSRPGEEFDIAPLNRRHDRAGFTCGVPALDRYLREQAGQDGRRGAAAVFVMMERATARIAGFYTLSSTAVDLACLPEEIGARLPRYPLVPATLLGRLAVDEAFRGRGFGRTLLIDALKRAKRAAREVAAVGVVVDAKDDPAVAFYERFGFIRFPRRRDRLFLPMRTINALEEL